MESSDNEDGSNPPEESNDDLSKEKMNLRKNIQELDQLVFEIKSAMSIMKFGDIRHLLKSSEPTFHPLSSRTVPDVETQDIDQLFKLAGMRCTKFTQNEYVFSFSSSGNIVGKDPYAVQITNIRDAPEVGKWVMPISIDISIILEETPLKNLSDLKPFLSNCKHYIDCYSRRELQYKELQPIVNELSGCWLDSRLGYSVITLKFFDIEDLDSGKFHDILLYLLYEPDRVWPHKIKIESLKSETLADVTFSKLKRYFKDFKSHDLKKAFETTVAAENLQIVWQRRQNQEALNFSDSSAPSSEEDFATMVGEKRRKSLRRGKKRKAAESPQDHYDATEPEQSSDHLDSQRFDDTRPSLTGSVKKRSEKAAKNKTKRRSPKKKLIEIAAAPKATKKKPTPKKNPKRVTEPIASTSRTNLRQSILGFQVQKPEKENREQLNKEEENTAGKLKSITNVTLLKKRGFGTSTPVRNLERAKKRFVNESNDVSPIKPAGNIIRLGKKN